MKVTKHAETRILQGDSRGPRTVLSVDEVLEQIASPLAIKMGQEIYFWSEADDCCLCAIVASGGKTLVTVTPTDRNLSPWMSMVSKFRKLNCEVWESQIPQSYNMIHAVMASLVLHDDAKGIEDMKELENLFVFFDFKSYDSASFWTKEFHKALAESIEVYLSNNETSGNRRKKISIRIWGNGWAFLCPIWVPFELLSLPNPLLG